MLAVVDVLHLKFQSFLEQLAPSGMRVTLAEGEKKEQNLKIGGGF